MLITCAQVVLVDDSNCIPKVQQLLKEYFGEEPSNDINPDEAVTYGAAVRDGILAGAEGTADVVLADVSRLALHIKHMPNKQGQIGVIQELANVYLKH
jgi:heat shock protein 5